jgi:hypothetical protein
MNARVVSGEILCEYCPSEHIELGRTENGETVTMPTALRRIVGHGPNNTLKLECSHNVYVLPPLRSAQEWVQFESGEVLQNGHLPVGLRNGR